MADPITIAYRLYCFVLGGVLGSFANVCIHRVPRGRSVVRPPSACPRCGRRIRPLENIPVLSFLLLRGRCAGCRRPISWRYPAVETLMAFLFLGAAVRTPPGPEAVLGAFFVFVLIVVSVIDLDWYIIPDVFSFGLFGVAVVLAPLNPALGADALSRTAGALGGGALGWASSALVSRAGRRFFRREALGRGDIKFLAGLGAFLGWRGVLSAWFLASLFGTGMFLWLRFRRKTNWGEYLPFGPFLAAGGWVHWMWPGLWTWWWRQ